MNKISKYYWINRSVDDYCNTEKPDTYQWRDNKGVVFTKDINSPNLNKIRLSWFGATSALMQAICKWSTESNVWQWFKGLIKDGYLLSLLSPIVLAYWIISTPIHLAFMFLTYVMWIPLSYIWTALIEYPMSILNGDELGINVKINESGIKHNCLHCTYSEVYDNPSFIKCNLKSTDRRSGDSCSQWEVKDK